MSKSIKLSNNMFIDSKGVDYKHTNLETTIDGINDKLNNVGVYSSNEIEVGKWTDGKTIYRKVITGTTVRWTGTDSFTNISLSTSKLINAYGSINYNNIDFNVPSNHTRIIRMNTNTIRLDSFSSEHGGRPFVLVVEYTK